nr:hypothetical protein GCM10020185_82660 [Pseudomonas brassicacearum subsp. brassicacearum]
MFDTATELMIRKGFHAASVNVIAEEAGFSKGAFFFSNFFSSKSDLLLQLTQRFKRVEIDRLSTTLASGYSAEQLSHGLNAYIDTLKNNTRCAILDAELQLIALRDEEFSPHYYDLHEEKQRGLGQVDYHHIQSRWQEAAAGLRRACQDLHRPGGRPDIARA